MDFIFEVGRSVDPVDFSAASVATLLPPPRPSATPPPAGDERAVLNLFSKLVGQGEKMAITLFMTKVRLSHGGVGQSWDRNKSKVKGKGKNKTVVPYLPLCERSVG